MIKKITISILLPALVFTVIQSCKKDAEINPFDDPSLKAPDNSVSEESLDPNSFEYLYKNVFKPTCANSSCHDGSFEPDFRTMHGAYNTLVWQPVLSNDNGLTYTYRVHPGNSTKSLITRRLKQMPYAEIGQGRMPWNDTNWLYQPKNATYIQNIVNWINAGAKDMFGKTHALGNKEPEALGLNVFPAGNTSNPYTRGTTGLNPIDVPANTNVDIWVYITDDSTSQQNMQVTDIKFSTKAYDFTNAVSKTLVYTSPVNMDDFEGTSQPFAHKLASFSTSGYSVGNAVFVRVYLRDTSHSFDTEIPNSGASALMVKYFCLKII